VVHGVPDRGRDPAVVAIDIGGRALCTGSLVAPNVVLTARHCVARTTEVVECPATAPQVGSNYAASSLHVIVGDDASTGRDVARGLHILAPDAWALCGADIALIILDQPVDGVGPLRVRRSGVAKGDHVRAVGYGRPSDASQVAGVKLLRDHVRVLEISASEFQVGEATCNGDSGGPALDDSTGEIVGVVSRGGPSCDGPDVRNIYTRADVFLPLIDEALRRAAEPNDAGDADAGVETIADAGKKKDAGASGHTPVTDMGAGCDTGADCSAGVCVSEHGRRYCSRTCGSGDRCPTHYGCTKATSDVTVCVQK
jgi:V8-like Glu-specific endopeptidase